MKLLCFPHAGGFSPYYSFLKKAAFRNINETYVFDYPRREITGENKNANFNRYIDSSVSYIRKKVLYNENYLLFGHSMGAFIACEAGLIMQNTYGQPPTGVIVSGQNPPYSEKYEKGWVCPEDPCTFVEHLGGIPDFIKKDQRMLKMILRYIETDMKAIQTYDPSIPDKSELLECGMIMRGSDDIIINPKYDSYWNRTFRKIYSETVFTGDHFYFNNVKAEVIGLIDDFAGSQKKETV
ncbi:MAG: thioesterase domain-containing protein [Oscillospiraceae bacterium]|nr:thioesterase domain-containing protein [Oscillospiraceae bacterium]